MILNRINNSSRIIPTQFAINSINEYYNYIGYTLTMFYCCFSLNCRFTTFALPKVHLIPPLPHPTAANFHFLLRRLYHPGKNGSNNSYAKLGGGGVGANKVRNGQCERSKFLFFILFRYCNNLLDC